MSVFRFKPPSSVNPTDDGGYCFFRHILKKVENHAHMVALYAVWYNWMKVHKTLRVTPAMQAGLADRVFDMTDLVALIEQAEAPQPAALSESDSL